MEVGHATTILFGLSESSTEPPSSSLPPALRSAGGDDEQRHACSVCLLVFMTAAELAAHTSFAEPDVKIAWPCALCAKVFSCEYGFAQHQTAVHRQQLPATSAPGLELPAALTGAAHVRNAHGGGATAALPAAACTIGDAAEIAVHVHVIDVAPSDAGMRAGAFVRTLDLGAHARISKAGARQLFHAGRVLVNGQAVQESWKLEALDRVSVSLGLPLGVSLPRQPQPTPLPLLYRDEHVAVVEKPVGMRAHGNQPGTVQVWHVSVLPWRPPRVHAAGGGRQWVYVCVVGATCRVACRTPCVMLSDTCEVPQHAEPCVRRACQ